MCRPSIFILVVLTLIRECYATCPPIPDSPTARLMYTSSNTIQVLPTSPLEEGTVATLKCHTGLKTSATAYLIL
ncbi:hypothetical protein OSTOST_19726 [Ostertagia ostertagi]